MSGLINMQLSWLLCLVVVVYEAAAQSEYIVTAYRNQTVSLTWQLDTPVPLTYLRHIDIIYASKTGQLVRCHIHPDYRCSIYRMQQQLDMVIIPSAAVMDTSIPVHTVGFTLKNLTTLEADTYTLRTDRGRFMHDGVPRVLYVFQHPETPFLVQQQIPVYVGHMLVIHCNTTSQSLPSEYNTRFGLVYTWTVEGLIKEHKQNNSVLIIENIQKSDAGARISCRAREENSTLVSDESPVLTLDVYYLEDIHFSDGLDQQEVLEGSKVTKTCQATCNPECQYQWVSETGLLLGTGTELTVDNVGLASEGNTYICEATNEAGTLTRTLHIDVLYKPEIIDFYVVPSPAVEGDLAKITCAVKNSSVTDMSIIANGTEELIAKQSTTKLEHTWGNVDCALNGDYECLARNQNGVVSRTLKLDVRCPPRIMAETSTSQKFELSDGAPFSLEINMVANPFPGSDDMTLEHLLKNGTQLRAAFTALVNATDHKLTIRIPSVTGSDRGMYALNVHNDYGYMMVLFEIVDPQPDNTVIGLSVSLALTLATNVLLGIMWYVRRKVSNKKPSNAGETSPAPPIYVNSAFDSLQAAGTNYEDLGPDKHMALAEPSYQDLVSTERSETDTMDPDTYEEVRSFAKRT